MDYDSEAESKEEEEDYEPIVLILAKQRNGPTGKINLAFRRKFTRFESMQQDHRLNQIGYETINILTMYLGLRWDPYCRYLFGE